MSLVPGRNIREATKRFIIGKSAGRCAKCKRELFVENRLGEIAALGENCHIYAHSDGGPRGNPHIKDTHRAKQSNLILLCCNCHTVIDKMPEEFTAEALVHLRDEHYRWVEDRLGAELISANKFHYLLYINLPRMDMYAVSRSIPLPNISTQGKRTIRDMGMDAGRLMASMTQIINDENLYANKLAAENVLTDLEIGSYWFIDSESFYTKKVPLDKQAHDMESLWAKGESLIWMRRKDFTIRAFIDPIYLTTSTAATSFRGGKIKLSGIINIREIDRQKRIVTTSPLFLGSPESGNGFI